MKKMRHIEQGPWGDTKKKGLLLLLLIVTVSLLALSSCAGRRHKPSLQSAHLQNERLRERWGIEFVALHLTAAGHMVDFRFRVIDPEKAAPLLSRSKKAYLIDERTGTVLGVPITKKVGPLKTATRLPKAGRIYFIFFLNANRIINKGSKVTIKIGKFRLSHIDVR